jgi:hypothetical protein
VFKVLDIGGIEVAVSDFPFAGNGFVVIKGHGSEEYAVN